MKAAEKYVTGNIKKGRVNLSQATGNLDISVRVALYSVLSSEIQRPRVLYLSLHIGLFGLQVSPSWSLYDCYTSITHILYFNWK